jgi:hypothetical protein
MSYRRVGVGALPQSGEVEDPSVVRRLTVVPEVVCALAVRGSSTALATNSITPLSCLVAVGVVSLGGGRVVGAGIA